MKDAMKIVRCLVLALPLILCGLPPSGRAQSSRQLDGWQKAKFGMSFEEVRAQYPDARVRSYVIERCRDYVSQDDIRESPRWKKDSNPHHACRYISIENYDSGQDIFDVNIYFSKTRNKLFQVLMLAKDFSKRNKTDYESYVAILKNKYGNYTTDLQQTSKSCEWMANSLDNVMRDDMVISEMVASYRKIHGSIFEFSNGKVSAYYQEPIRCDEYYPLIQRGPDWQKAISKGLNGKILQIIYHNSEEEHAIGDRF